MASVSHVIAAFLSMIGVMFASVMLGDGRCLMTADEDQLDRAQFPVFPYGLGLYADQQGFIWTEEENRIRALGCDEHENRLQANKAFVFFVIVLSFAAVAVHLTGAMTGQKLFGLLGVGIHAFLFVVYTVMMALTASVFDQPFNCDNSVRIKLRDQFRLNYGIVLLVIGMVASLANVLLLIILGALTDDSPAEPTPEEEPEAEEVPEKADN